MNINDYRIYVAEKQKKLTHEDELNFAIRILRGDEEAVQLLSDPYLAYALQLAERYHTQTKYKNLEIEVLIRLANEGLYRAANAYSSGEGKQFRFKEYSGWWIKQSIGSVLNSD